MTDSRQRLLDDLAVNTGEIAQLELDRERMMEAARSSNADDEHDPEGSTIAFEREQLSALLDRARQLRHDLQTALAGLDQGTYGVCERCGQPIGAERLEARPQARTCIECARSRVAR